MFVVSPMLRDSDVRSLLGFMSLASRWGDHLFPGITVLTRDLYAIQAMHQVAARMHAWEVDQAARFKKRSTDEHIAKQLSTNLARAGRPRPLDKLRQVMSYWQRYGSLFLHFDLLNEGRSHALPWYRELIFEDRTRTVGRDTSELRASRIEHFRWYQRYSDRLALHEETHDAFRGPRGRWRRWWLSGTEPPGSASEALRLVRQLEFFFTVWQTLFEAAVQAFAHNRRLRFRRSTEHDPLKRFAVTLAENRPQVDESTSRRLVELGLALHEKLIAPRLASWHRDAHRHLGSTAPRFTSLHADRAVVNMGQFSGGKLLQELVTLHCEYCEIQEKTYAVYASSFLPKANIQKVPPISARIHSGRWGLFGYRMQAAVDLHATASA